MRKWVDYYIPRPPYEFLWMSCYHRNHNILEWEHYYKPRATWCNRKIIDTLWPVRFETALWCKTIPQNRYRPGYRLNYLALCKHSIRPPGWESPSLVSQAWPWLCLTEVTPAAKRQQRFLSTNQKCPPGWSHCSKLNYPRTKAVSVSFVTLAISLLQL